MLEGSANTRPVAAPDSAARTRVLDVAERLFTERGYTTVTLKHIAAELGIRQASLYHHVPGGKEQLYVEVTERAMTRHQQGLTAAIAAAGPALQAQLGAAAGWLLGQPPVDVARMHRSDLPAIDARHAGRLRLATYRALIQPLRSVFEESQEHRGIRWCDAMLLAGAFIAMVEGIHDARHYSAMPPMQMAEQLIDVLLDGLRAR